MSESSYPFRTALGGFHKGDVTGFIEKTAALHRIELQEYEALVTSLREENRALHRQLENMCEDTLGKFQSTDSAVKQAIDMMMEQANALDQAYQALSVALNGSREKLASMNTLLLVEESKE